jgi:hypothetical protein
MFRQCLEILGVYFIGALFEIERGAGLIRKRLWLKRFSVVFRRVFKALIDAIVVVTIGEGGVAFGFGGGISGSRSISG